MSQKGFTIVELLIVIVVIAILAAITIVTYSGIQSRAHDASIRSDFRHIANYLEMYQTDNGFYPHDPAGNANANNACNDASIPIRTALTSIPMKLSTGSYDNGASNANVLYVASNDGSHYAILGYAKGNPTYYMTDRMRSADRYISNPAVPQSRFPSGTPCGIADNVGVSSPGNADPDFGFYYVYVGGAGGFRIWK